MPHHGEPPPGMFVRTPAFRGLRVVLACLALACARDATDTPDPSSPLVRDSAGIEIVENVAPEWRRGRAWRIAEAPSLVIGEDGSPAAQFDRIRAVLPLSSGVTVVADGRTNELRYFDARGTFVARVGGAGAGPGEFRHLTSVARLAGDSLLAFDQVLWRISVFSPTRALAREVSLTPVAAALEFVAQLADGRFLLATQASLIPEARPDGVHRFPRRFFRYSADGSRVDTVVTIPGYEFEIRFDERDSNWGATAVPFARNAVTAARNGRWLVGDNARFEITERDASGRATRIIRYVRGERVLTDSMVAELEGRTVAQLPTTNAARASRVRRLFRDVARPERLPAFSAVHLDPLGHLVVTEWVSGFDAADRAPSAWWVFDPDGRLLGSMSAPRGFTLLDIGIEYVAGVMTDDLGVQRVAVFALSRGADVPPVAAGRGPGS